MYKRFNSCVFVLAHSKGTKRATSKKRVGAQWEMPAGKERSSESEYTDVEVEPEAEARVTEATVAAAAKAAVPKFAGPKASLRVDLSESSSESGEEEISSATEGTPEEEPEKVDKTPLEEPKRGKSDKKLDNKSDKGRGKSKAKSGVGRRACPICWQMVVDTQAGMDQHQYWSVPCNAWRRHAKGTAWEKAVRSAEKQKERRTERFNASGDVASGSKPPAPKKEEKKPEKKAGKKKKGKTASAKASGSRKAKKEKRKRLPSSPEPRPAKKRDRRPDPSSHGGGQKKHQRPAAKNGPRSGTGCDSKPDCCQETGYGRNL